MRFRSSTRGTRPVTWNDRQPPSSYLARISYKAGQLLLSALASLAVMGAQAATSPVSKPSSKPVASKVQAAADPGFGLAPQPGWVSALNEGNTQGLPSASVQVLLIDRQTRLEAGQVQRFSRQIRQVNDSAGLQNAAQIEVDFDPSYQKLVMHKVDVWREGKRFAKLDRKQIKLLHRETQLERQIVDGRMTASIVLEDLRVGDRVEYAYSLIGDNPVFEGRFVDQEWASSSSGPIAKFQFRLLSGSQRAVRHRIDAAHIKVSERMLADGWRETLFEGQQIAQFRYDPLSPSSELYKDQIQLSEFADWADVAQWAEQLFQRAMLPSKALEEQAQAIKAKAASPAQRLRLALDFVQQEVRYFGTENGVNSHQPATAETVLRQRFGDCKDKAALLVSLLRALGVESQASLVSLAHRNQVLHRLPSPLAFDHAIVRTSIEGETLWLDATRSLQSGEAKHRQTLGLGYGLPAQTKAQLQELPQGADQLRVTTQDLFEFPNLSEPGWLRSSTTFYGELAERVREAKSNMPEQDFRNLLVAETLRFYPMSVSYTHLTLPTTPYV